jgi:hypothetical protein
LTGSLPDDGDARPRLGFAVTCCGTCLRCFIRVRSTLSAFLATDCTRQRQRG